MTIVIKQVYIKWLLMIVFVLMVATIVLATVVTRNSRNVDRMSASVDEVKVSVTHLEDFVDELETNTPEEQARNQAITRAVHEVPRIKDILCETFPEASACRGE